MPQNPIDLLRQAFKDLALSHDREIADKSYNGGGWFEEDRLDPNMVFMGPDLPPVRRPPMYRKETQVVGSPEFAQDVEQMFRDVPEMRGRAPEIRNSPNDGVFERLRGSKFKDDDYDIVNLLGTTNVENKRVTINPSLRGPNMQKLHTSDLPTPMHSKSRQYFSDLRMPHEPGEFERVLAHEMGHVVGQDHGPMLDGLQNAAKDAYGKKR